MKKVLFVAMSLMMVLTAFGQIKLPQVRSLESEGWEIQHSVLSWDSLSVYFSAKGPGQGSYDLYIVRAEGWRWTAPERIDALSTDADELWPSVSSDERMLFYVVKNADGPAVSQIWRAWNNEGSWMEAAPLIITDKEDSQPQIAEDNQTLTYMRREQTKRQDGAWHLMTATMIDDHNWTIPQTVEIAPDPQPVMAVSGTIVMQKGGRPLATGKVLVYDATKEQLLQTVRVHTMTGHWRAALQKDKHYRLALTADGYSYHYIDIATQGLAERDERPYGTIALDNELALTLQTYDAETQTILDARKERLSLGQQHTLQLRHAGYDDASLTVNTARPMVFTQTELDIPLQPKKSLHHFVVTNAQTGEAVPDLRIRLNGQPAVSDTALRINQKQSLQLSAPGFLFYDTLFSTGNDQRERTVQVALIPITKDLVLQLRNIQFEYNSYELTESSNNELESLAQLMRMNPTLRIELSAHTDDQGSDRYNDRLSEMRGKAVETWLVEQGIDASRMEAVGYGKRKPLVPNDSEEHRALNRRVEIKVLDF